MRATELVINDIKNLTSTKGYIYALCMIILEDFYINPEEIHEIDNMATLSIKEVSLLLGFFIQNDINFSIPNTPQDLMQLKQKTYELMDELHSSLMISFQEELQKSFDENREIKYFKKRQKGFVERGRHIY